MTNSRYMTLATATAGIAVALGIHFGRLPSRGEPRIVGAPQQTTPIQRTKDSPFSRKTASPQSALTVLLDDQTSDAGERVRIVRQAPHEEAFSKFLMDAKADLNSEEYALISSFGTADLGQIIARAEHAFLTADEGDRTIRYAEYVAATNIASKLQRFPVEPPNTPLVEAQQEYLRETQRLESDWSTLTKEEREKRQDSLKRTIIDKLDPQ